jgi:hypothetical protein
MSYGKWVMRITLHSLPITKKCGVTPHFLYGPPQMPLGPHPEPEVQVVAFRAHQALPVGRAQQHRYGPQPGYLYWFKEFKALTHTAGD